MDSTAPGQGPTPSDLTRRDFLKLSGGSSLSLSLSKLGGVVSGGFIGELFADNRGIDYQDSEDLYRSVWQWDQITWGSHTNICLPGGCSFRIYVKDGIVWREEQTAKNDASNPNYPDYNPMGCQKGCSFHNNIYGDERVKYPLKRVGERGEGKWERITWEEGIDAIAASIVDAVEEQGPDGFVLDPPHAHCGTVGWTAAHRMTAMIGGVVPDLNVLIGDFLKGTFDTLGKQHTGYSADNLFDAEMIFMTYGNWSYTYPAVYHFLTEARYNGTELVMIAPDYNATTICFDLHVPVGVGQDGGFWMCVNHVLIRDKLYDLEFAREQTDMALLVRTDTGKFLRAPEMEGVGREDQLYFYDETSQAVVQAPRSTLAFDGVQAIEGSYEVTLKNGDTVTVQPVFENLKKRVADFPPEKSQELCGVHPSIIEEFAKKIATKRTLGYTGFSAAKTYHGDLSERAMILALGLTGNWGKPGTGWNSWAMPADHVELLMLLEKPVKQGGLAKIEAMGQAIAQRVMAEDPEANSEIISIEVIKEMTKVMGSAPPVFWLYYHCGYKDLFDVEEWSDPALKRNFTDYLEEALEKGWWDDKLVRPAPDKTPRVLKIISSNPIRRVRSAAILYPRELFPKLNMIYAIEPRMSSSAMYADVFLPAAWYYEKTDFTVSITTNPRFCFIEKAVEPQGEARSEWEICAAILKRVGEIATERNLGGYEDVFGNTRRYDELYSKFTMDDHLLTPEDVVEEMTELASVLDIFPKDLTYDKFKEDGIVDMIGFGHGFMKDLVANEYDPTKPFFSLRWHVDEQKIYPTYARRAQFYIDHDWYLEADEHLPTHKEPPKIGGDYPFRITGGHPRHSVHSTHLAQEGMMKLHRGQPVMHMNDSDAMERGIRDGELVECFNDFSDFQVMVKISPSVQPKQVVIYFWEAYQFNDWKVYDRLLIGLPKALHLAGGYGQLRYYFYNGSPGPCTDRGVTLDIRKIKA